MGQVRECRPEAGTGRGRVLRSPSRPVSQNFTFLTFILAFYYLIYFVNVSGFHLLFSLSRTPFQSTIQTNYKNYFFLEFSSYILGHLFVFKDQLNFFNKRCITLYLILTSIWSFFFPVIFFVLFHIRQRREYHFFWNFELYKKSFYFALPRPKRVMGRVWGGELPNGSGVGKADPPRCHP